MGRPKLYLNEYDRKKAWTASRTKYMLNKVWRCEACETDYCMAGKWTHIKSKKHTKNQTDLLIKKENSKL